MLRDGLADLLAFIAGNGVFCPSEGIESGEFRRDVVGVRIITGDQKQCQLIRAGEGAVDFIGKAFRVVFEVPRFQRGLGVFRTVVISKAEIGEGAVFYVLDEAFIDDRIFVRLLNQS